MDSKDAYLCPMCGASIGEAMHECPACGEPLLPDGGQAPSESLDKEDFARAKRRRLLWMLGLSLAAGVAAALFSEAEGAIQIAAWIGIILFLASWCQLDARERDDTVRRYECAAIILFVFIGLPVYFLRTRGIRGFVSILLALLCYVALIAIQVGAMLLTHYLA